MQIGLNATVKVYSVASNLRIAQRAKPILIISLNFREGAVSEHHLMQTEQSRAEFMSNTNAEVERRPLFHQIQERAERGADHVIDCQFRKLIKDFGAMQQTDVFEFQLNIKNLKLSPS
ncbi:unnamed protein product [Ceratitis capitata]|uniref:(Mediterranean fruit fly) hypothetical protein n=1 Tax=Ceratitis capitata TaxID=7213 RepID=A0A811US78_CERCA|nr:unnamed protein product [Ceratitis capitata]